MVLMAKDGIEGAMKAEAENPDIIVSDVMMPRMNGTDMCRRIKENIETSHIPIILLTAWSTDEGTYPCRSFLASSHHSR